eukprot:365325-Chlamydomonas_euryale.AAC.17
MSVYTSHADATSACGVPCRWSTFCNHLTGEWYGQYGAYTPWEGQPEPVWLDENNRCAVHWIGGKQLVTNYASCGVGHMLTGAVRFACLPSCTDLVPPAFMMDRRYIDWNCSRSVEHRANSSESDDFLRKIVRGTSMDEAQ